MYRNRIKRAKELSYPGFWKYGEYRNFMKENNQSPPARPKWVGDGNG